ncbi:MAG: hypothetical protein M3R24_37805 [Chloroflexota bacterium]|nr:hypothetical protein [Chloroflexota bacterium]
MWVLAALLIILALPLFVIHLLKGGGNPLQLRLGLVMIGAAVLLVLLEAIV